MGSLLLVLMCLFIGAIQSESDPCDEYTVLNDSWRATTNLEKTAFHCDRDVQWYGWYRMFHLGESVGMPESCVPIHHCGTRTPLWMDGIHPQPEDGIVTRQICGHALDDCCYFRFLSIQVKACPGNYTVYQLVKSRLCPLGYCMEPKKRFQQRIRLKMTFQRVLSHAEVAQFTSQIREKLIQTGYPSDIRVRMM